MRVLLTLCLLLFSINAYSNVACKLFTDKRQSVKDGYAAILLEFNTNQVRQLDEGMIATLKLATIFLENATVTENQREAIASSRVAVKLHSDAFFEIVTLIQSLNPGLSAVEFTDLVHEPFIQMRKSQLASNIALIDAIYASTC